VALGWLAGRAAAARYAAAARRGDPLAPLRYARAQTAGRALLLAAHAALVYLFHWPQALEDASPWLLAPGVDLAAVLGPCLAALAASWAGQHPAESAARGARLTPGGHLRFQARMLAVFALAPLLLLHAVERGVYAVPAAAEAVEVYPFLMWIGMGGAGAAMLCLAPPAIRAAWGARPVPPGPLRDRLEACCARAGFRCRDLVIWPTGGAAVINAFIAGLVPRFRYVFFTDALIGQLHPAEVEAVLAHEIGHAQCRHLRWLGVLSLGYLAVAATFAEWAAGAGPLLQAVVAAGLLTGWWGGVFGYLSRRFETEADLYGARLLGDPWLFAATLERVGALAGAARSRGGWRHPSIAERTATLVAAAQSPLLEYRFRLGLRRLTGFAAAGVLAAVLWAWQAASAQLARAPAERVRVARMRLVEALWDQAEAERAAGRPEEAVRLLSEALDHLPDNAVLLAALGDGLDAAGKPEQALEKYRAARAAGPRSLSLRRHLAERLGDK
jgi:Zn-dependent protease with chaperone function